MKDKFKCARKKHHSPVFAGRGNFAHKELGRNVKYVKLVFV
jgi:hypothetical protein